MTPEECQKVEAILMSDYAKGNTVSRVLKLYEHWRRERNAYGACGFILCCSLFFYGTLNKKGQQSVQCTK